MLSQTIIAPLLIALLHQILSISGEVIQLSVSQGRHKRDGVISLDGQKGNLGGQPGDGYYVQVAMGTPPQLVSFKNQMFAYFEEKHYHLEILL